MDQYGTGEIVLSFGLLLTVKPVPRQHPAMVELKKGNTGRQDSRTGFSSFICFSKYKFLDGPGVFFPERVMR